MKRQILVLLGALCFLSGCGATSTSSSGSINETSTSSSGSINETYFKVTKGYYDSFCKLSNIKIVIRDNKLQYYPHENSENFFIDYEIHREGDFIYTLKVDDDKLRYGDSGETLLYCFVNSGLLSAIIQEKDSNANTYHITKRLFCTESYDLSRIV